MRIDQEILEDIRLTGLGYKKYTNPILNLLHQYDLEAWIKECLPDCIFRNGMLYYKKEAELTLFRLRWYE
jgi:hypothetical protein